MLVDFDKAKTALNELIKKSEDSYNHDLQKVVVGVAGSHLSGQKIETAIDLADGIVTLDEINRLSEKAEEKATQNTREILHCHPISFSLDDRDPVENPLHLSGRTLTGTFFIIDADRAYLKDLVRLFNLCGLEITQFYSEPFASASVTTTEEQKNLGIAIADIGGGTTDGIVYQNGHPVDIFTINIAGSLMTRDLSIGLQINQNSARMLKEEIGLGHSQKKGTVTTIYGKEKSIESYQVNQILAPRVLELGAYIASALKQYRGSLSGGIFFTGGGSNLSGIVDFLKSHFKIHVDQLLPHYGSGDEDAVFSSRHATVIGLINLELERLRELDSHADPSWKDRFITPIYNWIKELS